MDKKIRQLPMRCNKEKKLRSGISMRSHSSGFRKCAAFNFLVFCFWLGGGGGGGGQQ